MLNQIESLEFTSAEEQIGSGASEPFIHETGVQRYVRKTLFEMHKSINFGRNASLSNV